MSKIKLTCLKENKSIFFIADEVQGITEHDGSDKVSKIKIGIDVLLGKLISALDKIEESNKDVKIEVLNYDEQTVFSIERCHVTKTEIISNSKEDMKTRKYLKYYTFETPALCRGSKLIPC